MPSELWFKQKLQKPQYSDLFEKLRPVSEGHAFKVNVFSVHKTVARGEDKYEAYITLLYS